MYLDPGIHLYWRLSRKCACFVPDGILKDVALGSSLYRDVTEPAPEASRQRTPTFSSPPSSLNQISIIFIGKQRKTSLEVPSQEEVMGRNVSLCSERFLRQHFVPLGQSAIGCRLSLWGAKAVNPQTGQILSPRASLWRRGGSEQLAASIHSSRGMGASM